MGTQSRGRGNRGSPPHLHTDDDDEGGGHGDSEGLVVSEVGVVAEDPVRDEEHEDGGVDPLGDADEELPLVEEEVQLAGFIQLGVLQTAVFRHILEQAWRDLPSPFRPPGITPPFPPPPRGKKK